MNNFSHSDLRRVLIEENPSLGELDSLEDSLHFLISSQHLQLSKKIFDRAQAAIQSLFAYAHTEKHLQDVLAALDPLDKELLQRRQRNNSVLMAYDFHYDQAMDQLSLIEVNTNASGFMFADALYRFKGLRTWESARTHLWEAFLEEYKLVKPDQPLNRIDIIDENILSQKMYPEFLMFQEWFQKQGKQSDILDYAAYTAAAERKFVYNRYCDFSLREPRSKHLRDMYLNGDVVFSPSPHEYLLLSDKMRLFDFYQAGVSDVVIPLRDFREFAEPDELWTERKKYYFKPKRMYGGKAVFRGESISRKKFNEIFLEEYLAQETRPPGLWNEWKYDLRFYVYRDQIQLAVARLFQGQLLNFSHPDGGLATVEFI